MRNGLGNMEFMWRILRPAVQIVKHSFRNILELWSKSPTVLFIHENSIGKIRYNGMTLYRQYLQKARKPIEDPMILVRSKN